MTREEAMYLLNNLRSVAEGKEDEAIDMAIEALSEETSTINEKHQLSEETPTDLISRAEAVKAIRKCKFESDMPSDWYKGMETAQDILSALPSADAVQRGKRGRRMTDIITYCDVIEDCKDCPRYAWECDGRDEDDD